MLNKVPSLLRTIQTALKELWLLVVVVFALGAQWTQFNSRVLALEAEVPKMKPLIDYLDAQTKLIKEFNSTNASTITSFNELKSVYVEGFSDLESRLEALFGPRNRLEDGLIKKILIRLDALERESERDPQQKVGAQEKNKRGHQ